LTRADLIEKNTSAGNPNGFNQVNQSTNVPKIGTLVEGGRPEGTIKNNGTILVPLTRERTRETIAKQLGVGEQTVVRASEFTLAVDKIVANTFYCALLP